MNSTEQRWNPAAIGALARGDLANAIIASTPGGIEAQEAQGQQDFVANETLPIKFNYCTREQIEAMGIVYGDPVDDLFVEVTLPDGWHKQPTGHSMWSYLLDDQGRKRASIFYKAAFYDRRAFIDISRRYSCSTVPVLGYDDPDYRAGEWHCTVTDHDDAILWTSKTVGPEPPYSHGGDEKSRSKWLAWVESKNALALTGREWLDENYPDWQDPLAYW